VSPTWGALPCHLSTSPAGDLVAVANHGSYEYIVTTATGDGFRAQRAFDSGAVALFAVDEDGSLGGATDVVVLDGRDEGTRAPVLTDPSGQFTGEFQASSHPHAAVFHPTAPIVVVPDKGTDAVVVMQVDADARRLHPVHRWQSQRGSGPRHATFHPTLPVVYVAHELVPSLTVLTLDTATGRIDPIQSAPTIPDAVVGTWPSEVVMHPTGRFLHVSNRGHDSIATFLVRPNGTLGTASVVGCGGRTPRAFGLDPSGSWLLVLNQDSGTVVSFAIDADGSPARTGAVERVERPVSIAVGR
jgi:6-phosphogluconolactonase